MGKVTRVCNVDVSVHVHGNVRVSTAMCVHVAPVGMNVLVGCACVGHVGTCLCMCAHTVCVCAPLCVQTWYECITLHGACEGPVHLGVHTCKAYVCVPLCEHACVCVCKLDCLHMDACAVCMQAVCFLSVFMLCDHARSACR